jgi:peptide/nickel transport system substrate-binding protein
MTSLKVNNKEEKVMKRTSFSFFVMVMVLFVAVTTGVFARGETEAATGAAGDWVDEIIVTQEPSAPAAMARLGTGELDIYAFAVSDPEVYQQMLDNPNIQAAQSYGSYNELTFNPAGPEFPETGKLNPFSVPRIREAMNWLIDRNHIGQEIMGGMGIPRFTPLTSAFPDYARLADVVRKLELTYAHNPEKAEQVISEEMQKLGATKVDGKWTYKDEPVEIIVLIRTEDARKDIGDYVSTLLEGIGFTVDRQYKTSAEASPIWIQGDPGDGKFHIYTGGWVTTVVSRDQSGNFSFFYTKRGLPFPLWQAYTPTDEFNGVAEQLENSDFSTMEERRDLFAKALELSFKDSIRIWLVDRQSFSPYRSEVTVAADLAGAISGGYLWALTLQKDGPEGDRVNIAMPSILPEPWNPLGGSNWIYDMMLIRGTGDNGVLYDPYTGLVWPQRIERAEVTVQEGLPVAKTHDWVSLEFESEIEVPKDAWIDWDAESQEFITVGDKHPEGITAKSKNVVYYPDDLYDTVKWHDGSSFSMLDILMGMILTFDRSKPESPYYDAATAADFESFQKRFKGVKIISEDPLVIETYSDYYALDAELTIDTWFPGSMLYAYGQGAWHTLSIALRAEGNQELAFSSDKADKIESEWTSFVAGPSMSILERHLEEAMAEDFVPYEIMKDYADSGEIDTRYQNLMDWYEDKGHFWVNSGPYYLEEAFPVEKNVYLKRFEDFPDSADKWKGFGEPKIAAADVSGPASVTAGSSAKFEVSVTYRGAVYPQEELDQVKYLLFNAAGEMVSSGDAQAAGGGTWEVNLSAKETEKLSAGASRLEIAVVSKLVSIPTFDAVEFVTK